MRLTTEISFLIPASYFSACPSCRISWINSSRSFISDTTARKLISSSQKKVQFQLRCSNRTFSRLLTGSALGKGFNFCFPTTNRDHPKSKLEANTILLINKPIFDMRLGIPSMLFWRAVIFSALVCKCPAAQKIHHNTYFKLWRLRIVLCKGAACLANLSLFSAWICSAGFRPLEKTTKVFWYEASSELFGIQAVNTHLRKSTGA